MAAIDPTDLYRDRFVTVIPPVSHSGGSLAVRVVGENLDAAGIDRLATDIEPALWSLSSSRGARAQISAV